MLLEQKKPEKIIVNQTATNYTKQLHLSGIRQGHNVLVIGAGNRQLLQALAKLIGHRGTITVVASDPIALAEIESQAEAGQFTALKPFSGSHPAFDLRTNSQRRTPVMTNTYRLTSSTLPFANHQFDSLWMYILPSSFSDRELTNLDNELVRVTKQRRQVVTLASLRSIPAGMDPLFAMLIG